MSRGVEHDPNVVLWLEVRRPRATGCSPRDGGDQVIYLNVEVLRGGLTVSFGGPGWNPPMLLELEVEREARRPDLGPARLLWLPWPSRIERGDLSAEQSRVEPSELAGSRRHHGDRCQSQRRLVLLHGSDSLTSPAEGPRATLNHRAETR
jgi:hypothetical protein